MRGYESVLFALRGRFKTMILEMLWQVTDASQSEALAFPSEDLLDELQAYDSRCRETLRRALHAFAQNLMQQICLLSLPYVTVRYYYKGCDLIQGNIVLTRIPLRKSHHVSI